MTIERLVVSVSLALLAAGCADDGAPVPKALSDGTPARPPPVELQGVDGPVVATRLRVVPLSAVPPGSTLGSCFDLTAPTRGVAVERIDARGRSVTYVDPSRRAAFACDAVTGASTTEASWCGRSFGRLVLGRLRDPRLSLACEDVDGEVVGYAWVQPAAETTFVVVAHTTGYSESYRVAGAVPVRVRTDDVEVDSSGARFDVSEHGRDGRRLRAYELEAAVSG